MNPSTLTGLILLFLSLCGIIGWYGAEWLFTRSDFPKYRVRYWSKPLQGGYEPQVKTSYFMPWRTIGPYLKPREPLQDVFGGVTMDDLKQHGDVVSLPKDAEKRIQRFDREYHRENKSWTIENTRSINPNQDTEDNE